VKHTKGQSRTGDFAEYYAVTWLWDNGYEVFQNSGCTGPVDMVAIDKNGKTILIDVKTKSKDKRYKSMKATSGGGRTKKQIELGVQILAFDPRNRSLRFVDHR
tara:strand:- start:1575 stop:1883 length:309 start_codon:yes stop_codon:yes gene_type:complete